MAEGPSEGSHSSPIAPHIHTPQRASDSHCSFCLLDAMSDPQGSGKPALQVFPHCALGGVIMAMTPGPVEGSDVGASGACYH